MAIILPHGVLFRGGAEERIRTKLLKDGTSTPSSACLPTSLFHRHPRLHPGAEEVQKPDDVLFINAAEHFDRQAAEPAQGRAHRQDIRTYQFRRKEARYSRRVEMAEIEENGFNLNISRYVSTAVGGGGD